jgi:hypothetical protein
VKEANEEIRRFCENLSGFAKIHILGREQNVGVSANLRLAADTVFSRHDRMILLEDDNVVARNFLAFMNAGLQRFANDPKCFCICGYSPPVTLAASYHTDIYKSAVVSAWGLGFFRDRYIRTDLEMQKPLDWFFANPANLVRMNGFSPPLFSLLVHGHMSRQELGDVLYSNHILKHGMFSVSPVHTKVINNGHDGSGAHCGKSDTYANQGFEQEDRSDFTFAFDERTSREFRRAVAQFHKATFGHSWGRSAYSYQLYLLCLLLGRQRVFALKEWMKATLARLGWRRRSV